MPRKVIQEKTEFRFSELSDKAKDSAIERFYRDEPFSWCEECMDSIHAFLKMFGFRMNDWNIDWSYPGQSWTVLDDEVGYTLADVHARLVLLCGSFDPETYKGLGDCKLTGTCWDEHLLDGMRISLFGGESDVKQLMHDGIYCLNKATADEIEYQQTHEAFAELCEANGYWFDEVGHLV